MADVDTIRLLISDLATEVADRSFTDADLQAFLDLEGSVKLAAAQALDALASNEALVSKRIRTLDLQTDGPAVAKALREHAAALRSQVAAAASSDADDLAGEFEVTTCLGTPELTERARWAC